MEDSGLLSASCKLDVVLGDDGENALKSDGEADCRYGIAGESADEVVVASAAGYCSAELLACYLEYGAGVVALTPYQGRVEFHGVAFGKLVCGFNDGAELLQRFLCVLGAVLRHVVQGEITLGEKSGERFNCGFRHSLFAELSGNAVGADLVQLVEAYGNCVEGILRESHCQQRISQHAAVVDAHGEFTDTNSGKRFCGDGDKFDLTAPGIGAEYVDIALHEFAESAALRSFRAVHLVDLNAMDKDGRLEDKDKYMADVLAREESSSTAIGFETATPHAKSTSVKEPSLAFARLKHPIKWDDEEVSMIFQIAVPSPGQGDRHLEILSKLFRNLVYDSFRDQMLQATTKEEIVDILKEF